MSSPLSRRSFLQSTLGTGALLLTGASRGHGLVRELAQSVSATPVEIAAVTGANAYDATVKAVNLLGGMSRFVSRGSRVGLLINSRFNNRGSYVKPQIALAAVIMLQEAGAKEIVSLEDVGMSYWRRALLTAESADLVKSIKGPGGRVRVSLSNSRHLKDIEILRDYLECDAVVNVAIFKDHTGTRFTGALKNIMGTTSSDTNTYWHTGSGTSGYYEDVKFLSQCIADGNLCRTPTLCIGDATEVLVRNGPFGPGPTKDFRTVVAGTNPVSFDAYGSTILGFKQDDILIVRYAAELGIGTHGLDSVHIEKASL
jgi:uncharacterized protein (DUF362 family)